ncbi:MAG: oligoendopeptidase F [Chloroflexi bacterium HGW-Chloroflexi-6]|nr:MAG: oligoendopeptidase F [Chloroflexi bacterium HGW-Chloroflexi-6]
MTTATLPRWDLSNVYPGLDSSEFKAALAELDRQIGEMEVLYKTQIAPANAGTDPKKLNELVNLVIKHSNEISDLAATLGSYLHSFIATDSYNKQAMRLFSEFQQRGVKLSMLVTQTTAWIGSLADVLPQVLSLGGEASSHAYFLKLAADQSKYLMSESEEGLAAELSLSGAQAWGKLQGTLTSQLSVDFELDGEVKKLPMPALINLRSHPDEDTRRRAYKAENAAWETVKEPLAAAMNGIKGTVNVLNKRRGREDALHSAIDNAHMDRASLEAMLEAMRDSFPMFQRYFKAKAKHLGKEKLAWWDLFAPVGQTASEYSWSDTRTFILEQFGSFAPEMQELSRRAFDENWIDAEQRSGKRGGAFCMGVPLVKESRVLTNFDGTPDQVSTVAHELGHAFHNECAFRFGKTALQQDTPMTLAETASIMCETIASQALLKRAANPQEELAVLELSLNGASQVIVDIYSRFLFEKEVFERREKSELSADELCEIMEKAQRDTYGEGLDERYLQKWMWTWKPHYYAAELSFYNFPYAFGLLFATGLYAIYTQRGAAFVPDYMHLLASTGEAPAAELAARFGIDIRSKKFWEDSIKTFEAQIARYEAI